MTVVILDTPTHKVTSYSAAGAAGNGLAYRVERRQAGPWSPPPLEFFLKGDEAATFGEAIFGQDVWDLGEAIDLLYGEAFRVSEREALAG